MDILKDFLNNKVLVKRTLCILFSLLLIANFTVFAQKNYFIKGVVRTVEKEPVVGAIILEKGVKRGTTTDVDGKFSISLSSADAILSFSYMGMITKDITVNGKTSLDVILEEDTKKLSEIVVTALGIKRDSRALGYSMAEVKGDELTAGRETNLIQALSGKVAGVDISSTSAGPSGSTRVVIRGNSELSGDNMPLYVVDGVPMDNTQLGSADKNGGYDFGDGLSAISPQDIESVSVLKGASAAALYGSRATHGVILITTKKWEKKKGIGIEFTSNLSEVKLLSGFDDYQRVYGQGRQGKPPLDLVTAQGTTQVSWGAKLDPSINAYIYNGQIKPYGNVPNNVLSFLRDGSTLSNSISFTAANGFRASITDMRNNDIVPNSGMHRTTFMVRGSSAFGKKITVESRVNYTTETVDNRPALSDSPNNIGNSIIGLAPSFNQKWLSENYKDEFGRYIDWNGGNIYRMNPYWVINEMSNSSEKNRVMGYMMLNYKPFTFLNIQLKGGTDFYSFESKEYSPLDTPTSASGEYKLSQMSVNESNFEALIRFNKQIDKLNVSAFVGGNLRYNERKTYINDGADQVQPGIKSILNYRNYTLGSTDIRKQVNSLYGAVNLGYDDYAYLDFTLRNDVSSTLAPENRSYLYPSVSGSFVFSSFFNMEKNILSFGKVRASWAQVGGDTSPYQLNLNYGLYPYTFQGAALGSINTSRIPNASLKPTQTNSYEVGTNLRFLKGRIILDLGYYDQSTINQILSLSTTVTSGYSSAMINSGEIVNKGVEISLSATPVKTKNFEWNTALNFAKNKNQVVKLHPDVKNYQLAASRWAGAFIYATEGEEYGVIVGKGFNRDPNGNVIFKNGLPSYETNLKVLGKGTPDFTLGFNQTFVYKSFSLSMLFDMKWGADIYSMSSLQSYQNGTSKATLEGREGWYDSEEQRNAANVTTANWIPTGGYVGKGVKNTGTDANPVYVANDVFVDPQTYWSNVGSNTAEPFIYDDSYIKLREMNLSYSLPDKLIKKTPFISVSLSVYGRNLLILYSAVKNIDPESNYNSGNGQGFEYGSLPSRRNFGFGLTVKM